MVIRVRETKKEKEIGGERKKKYSNNIGIKNISTSYIPHFDSNKKGSICDFNYIYIYATIYFLICFYTVVCCLFGLGFLCVFLVFFLVCFQNWSFDRACTSV